MRIGPAHAFTSGMQTALILASTMVYISGGDPATEARVVASFKSVPECLREGLESADIDIKPGPSNASYSFVSHRLGVTDRILVDSSRLEDEAGMEPRTCAEPGELEPLLGNLDRVLLHEIAHAYHFDVRGGLVRPEIDRFLDLRWRDAMHAWEENKERIRLSEQREVLQNAILFRIWLGLEPLREDVEEICNIQRQLDELRERMPSRFPGDYHIFSNKLGAEYFAIAVETLVYDHAVFCSTYSVEEIAMLHEILGQCLASFRKRAACYDAVNPPTAQPAQGAGMRRD